MALSGGEDRQKRDADGHKEMPMSTLSDREKEDHILLYSRERRRIRQSIGRGEYPSIKLGEITERSRGYTDRKLCSPCL